MRRGKFHGEAAFVSYLMISILPSLVKLLWVGYLAASAAGENMTSLPVVCTPNELVSVCVCVCAHRLMLWSFNHR